MKQKKMNALLRVLFIVLIIAIFGAAILQIFAPEYMGRSAAYGIAKGWQRGIGIGTNHFVHYLQMQKFVNLLGAVENYLLVIGWIIGWRIEEKRQAL